VNFFGARRINVEGGPLEEFDGEKERPSLSLRQRNRLDRDRERGYSINVKQIVLAFAVEFVIIGLILANLIGKSEQEVAIFRIKDDGSLAFAQQEQFKLDVANIFVQPSGGSAKPIPVEKFWRELNWSPDLGPLVKV